MTSRDLMTFGKFGKSKLGPEAKTVGWIKENEPDYINWLVSQDGFATKNPALYKFFTTGEESSSTPEERTTIDQEGPLLDPMPPAFKAFWKRAYGERMRVHGQLNYIAFLRVAVETWKEAAAHTSGGTWPAPASASVPEAHKPKMLPPPLSHIPAPNVDPLKADLSTQNTFDDGRDETVNF
jgi:hypothetical protein